MDTIPPQTPQPEVQPAEKIPSTWSTTPKDKKLFFILMGLVILAFVALIIYFLTPAEPGLSVKQQQAIVDNLNAVNEANPMTAEEKEAILKNFNNLQPLKNNPK
ncbi:MAG: hypothetical protein WC795_01490 [Candidatus Paceibacterota bacterium]|jgi:uncharacterized protein YpmS